MTEEEVAVEAALAAATLLEDRGGPLAVRHKGAVDLVTELDEQCEDAIRAVLARHTPDLPVLGEEGGGAESAATRWVVDPIDGTTNFVHGIPHYSISIALEVDGDAHVGVVHEVSRRRTLRATQTRGAFCEGAPLKVSDVRELPQALSATGFAYDRREDPEKYVQLVRMALVHTQGLRRMGSAALDLAYVAEGRLDAYFEYNLQRWDAAAGVLLVREAGGRVSPIPGFSLGDRPCPVASNPWVHDALIELIGRTIHSAPPSPEAP